MSFKRGLTKMLKKLQFQGGVMQETLTKAGGAGIDNTGAYRYPAPASHKRPNVPAGPAHRVYDIRYFDHDTRRNRYQDPIENAFHLDESETAATFRLPATNPDAKPSSQGTGNPDVLRYNPDGLRSAMTASWSAMEAELERNEPDHLVRYEWADEADEIIKSYEAKGIPPLPGKIPANFNNNSRKFNDRW